MSGPLGEDPVFRSVVDQDECPGKYDPPGHLKPKENALCGYCSLKTESERFVCRREGHKPSLTVTSANGVSSGGIICACLRCGKLAEFTLAECAPAPVPAASREDA